MKKVLLFSLLIFFPTIGYSAVKLNWVQNPGNGHYYALTNSSAAVDSMTWMEAEALAVSYGGHLVTINDATEQQWIYTNFGQNTSPWIGLTDKENEGEWKWSSGEVSSYLEWRDGYPYSDTQRNFARLISWEQGKWDHNSATDRYPGLIEVSIHLVWNGPTAKTVIKDANAIIEQDTIWRKADSPYVIEDDVLVKDGALLLIEPGTQIWIKGRYTFYIQGKIHAVGINAERITFDILPSNLSILSWGGIQVANNGDNVVRLEYCDISHAITGLNIEANYNVIYYSSFNDCINNGLFITGSNNKIRSCSFLRNGGYGWFSYNFNYGEIKDCIFNNNHNGMSLSIHGTDIINCQANSNHRYGMLVSGFGGPSVIKHCMAENNGISGIYAGFQGNAGKILYSSFINNGKYGIFVGDNSRNAAINYCNLFGNQEYALNNGNNQLLDASKNYWGNAITAEMQALGNTANISGIYDIFENVNSGRVFYNQFLTQEVDITPEPTPTPTPIPSIGAKVLSIPHDLSAEPGSSAEVDVNVDNAEGILGYRLVITYDPNLVSYVPSSFTTSGTLTGSFTTAEVSSNQSGRLVISSAGSQPLPAQAGALVKFRLKLARNTQLSRSFGLNIDTDFTQLNDGHITYSTQNGLLGVKPFTWGNLNFDSVAGTLDASLLLKYTSFMINSFPAYPEIARPDYPANADINGDNVAGTLDASLLLQKESLMITHFPVDTNQDHQGPESSVSGKVFSRPTVNATSNVQILTTVEPASPNSWKLRIGLNQSEGIAGLRLALRFDKMSVGISEGDIACLVESIDNLTVARVLEEGILVISTAFAEPLPAGQRDLFSIHVTAPESNLLDTSKFSIVLDEDITNLNDGQIRIHPQSFHSISLQKDASIFLWDLY